jgi:hypothetical protein
LAQLLNAFRLSLPNFKTFPYQLQKIATALEEFNRELTRI